MTGKTAGAFAVVIIGFTALGFGYAAVWTSENNLSTKFALSAFVTLILFILATIGWAILQIEDEPPVQKTDKVPE